MRLVDADAYKAEGRELYREAGWDLREVHYSQLDTECNIDMMPTIEAEPVKHGRWEYDEKTGNYYCSECRRRGGVYIDEDEGVELLGNYCGNCGAKMDVSEAAEIINDGTYSAGEED